MSRERTSSAGREPRRGLGRSTRWFRALALGALASCGWHAGLELPPEARERGASTLGIEIFQNTSFERDLESRLHAQLSRAASELLPVALVAPSRADLRLSGRIRDYRRRGGVRNRENELLESGVQVTLEAELSLATGEVLRATQAHVWVGFVLGSEEGEAQASERALEHLSERIVLDLFGPGGLPPGVLQTEEEDPLETSASS